MITGFDYHRERFFNIRIHVRNEWGWGVSAKSLEVISLLEQNSLGLTEGCQLDK